MRAQWSVGVSIVIGAGYCGSNTMRIVHRYKQISVQNRGATCPGSYVFQVRSYPFQVRTYLFQVVLILGERSWEIHGDIRLTKFSLHANTLRAEPMFHFRSYHPRSWAIPLDKALTRCFIG